jgi:ribosome maturation protein SDO1
MLFLQDRVRGMVSVDDATIARLSKGDAHFEILVDPDLALRFRKGESMNIENILAAQDIFSDAKKGERASEEDLKKVFGKADVFTMAASVIRHGELQLTTEQRRRFTEEEKAR